ncbi:MAG: class I tRNA ligase family protein, partial [Patescibacteria group bacterium]
IVWVISIPDNICTSCDQGFPDLENTLSTCSHCQGTLVADPDTFDTWFSSGQWPLLTLGYPDSKDFQEYYPTDVMETGADLVFKWVPRMIMFGMYLAKREPFKTVYFHGMVNDEHNQKMSKSKGNVISPVELSDQFGTDAMRMALITGNGPGNNIPLSFPKVEAFRNFANKLWNMSRYVSLSYNETTSGIPVANTLADRFILARLGEVIEETTAFLDKYQFSLASETLKDFTWNEFADWYIEIHKIEKNDTVLQYVFETLLKLWHPFMPFVTEAIQQTFHPEGSLLMIAEWPKRETKEDTEAVKRFRSLIGLISEVRSLRSLYHIAPSEELEITATPDTTTLLEENEAVFKKMVRVSEIHQSTDTPHQSALAQFETLSVFIHLEGVIDIEKEQARLKKEQEFLEKYKAGIESRLNDTRFTDKAPAHIIEQNKAALSETEKKINELTKYQENLVA